MVLKLRVAYTFSKFFERPTGLCDGYTQNTAGSVYIRWIGKNIRRKAVADGLPVLYPRVCRFCLVLTRDRTLADDQVQATSERALMQDDKFEVGTTLDR